MRTTISFVFQRDALYFCTKKLDYDLAFFNTKTNLFGVYCLRIRVRRSVILNKKFRLRPWFFIQKLDAYYQSAIEIFLLFLNTVHKNIYWKMHFKYVLILSYFNFINIFNHSLKLKKDYFLFIKLDIFSQLIGTHFKLKNVSKQKCSLNELKELKKFRKWIRKWPFQDKKSFIFNIFSFSTDTLIYNIFCQIMKMRIF